MPKNYTIQQVFSRGELDPKLLGRTDLPQYLAGAEKMQNVFVLPQGGFTRRPGLEFIDEVYDQLTRIVSPTIVTPNGGTGANANDNSTSTELTTTTAIGTINPYIALEYNLGAETQIEKVHIKGIRLSTGTGAEFFLQISRNGTEWETIGDQMSLTTSDQSFSFRVKSLAMFVRLVRVGATDLTTATVTLDEMNVWSSDFTQSDTRIVPFAFDVNDSFILVFSDKNIAVYKDKVHQVDIEATDFTSAKISRINWTQSADTMILVHETIAPHKLTRVADDNFTLEEIVFDFVPKFAFDETTSNPADNIKPDGTSGNITVTITPGPGVFTAAMVNQKIQGNGGLLRITEFVSATEVKTFAEIPLFNDAIINSGDWTLIEGFEDTWSATRGFPLSVTFYEGRLWFGGTRSRPQTLHASRVSIFFDFNPGQALDDDGIDATLDTDQINKVANIIATRFLSIFTIGGEFIIQQPVGEPITPTNVNFKRQSSNGSKQGLRPVEIEGGVLYIQQQGRQINEFVFDEAQNAFTNNIISLLSSHLVSNPTDFASRRSTSTDQTNFLLLVNDTGNLVVISLLISENLIAFTEQVTDGTFKNTGVDIDNMYTIVDRDFDIGFAAGTTTGRRRLLEVFNFSHCGDSGTRFTTGLSGTTEFCGLEHLNGKTVEVNIDGKIFDSVIVADGCANITTEAENSVEFRLSFTPIVTDLPVDRSFDGVDSTFGFNKNISNVDIRMENTQNLTVNGKQVPFPKLVKAGEDGHPLDQTPPSFTGVKRLKGFRGWDNEAQLTFSQTKNINMTVLAFTKKVNTSG